MKRGAAIILAAMISFWIGVVITLATAKLIVLFSPAGVVFYGYPTPWLGQGSCCGPSSNLNLYSVTWSAFFSDSVIWTILVFVILLVCRWAIKKRK